MTLCTCTAPRLAAIAAVFGLLLGIAEVSGQTGAPDQFRFAFETPRGLTVAELQGGRTAPTMSAGTLVGGALGLAAGLGFGTAIDCASKSGETDGDECLGGAVIGAAVLTALGTHLGNRGRGNLLVDGLVTGGVGLAWHLTSAESAEGSGWVQVDLSNVMMPVVMLLSAAVAETLTTPGATRPNRRRP